MIDEINILPNHQFGFKNEHSMTQQIARLTEAIVNKSNTRKIFLDITKAFDQVWHNRLIHTMKKLEYQF